VARERNWRGRAQMLRPLYRNCIKSFKKETEPPEKLKPPSVTNMKKSLSVLQKHVMRRI